MNKSFDTATNTTNAFMIYIILYLFSNNFIWTFFGKYNSIYDDTQRTQSLCI